MTAASPWLDGLAALDELVRVPALSISDDLVRQAIAHDACRVFEIAEQAAAEGMDVAVSPIIYRREMSELSAVTQAFTRQFVFINPGDPVLVGWTIYTARGRRR